MAQIAYRVLSASELAQALHTIVAQSPDIVEITSPMTSSEIFKFYFINEPNVIFLS